MSEPNVQIVRKQTNPGLMDLLNLFKKQVKLEINCHAVGTIQAFNSEKQTANITINYKKTFDQRQADGTYKKVLIDYPILVDCPVVILSGGNAALTFPITQGDECLVLFNDRDIDNWFKAGQVGAVASSRLHSMSDGFALVGVSSMANTLANYDSTRAVLRNGEALVGVGESLILLNNASNISLGTSLGNLLTALSTFSTALSGATDPVVVAAAAALSTSLTTVTTQIAGLLE